MADFMKLAAVAYAYAEANYGKKGARFDWIVECYSKQDIADALADVGADSEAKAKRWAAQVAGAAYEADLNAAWDGPESVKSSPAYDPAHDPAGPGMQAPNAPPRNGFVVVHESGIPSFGWYPDREQAARHQAALSRDGIAARIEDGVDESEYYAGDIGPCPYYEGDVERVGPDDDVDLEERFAHYAFEERNGMPYGSSF